MTLPNGSGSRPELLLAGLPGDGEPLLQLTGHSRSTGSIDGAAAAGGNAAPCRGTAREN